MNTAIRNDFTDCNSGSSAYEKAYAGVPTPGVLNLALTNASVAAGCTLEDGTLTVPNGTDVSTASKVKAMLQNNGTGALDVQTDTEAGKFVVKALGANSGSDSESIVLTVVVLPAETAADTTKADAATAKGKAQKLTAVSSTGAGKADAIAAVVTELKKTGYLGDNTDYSEIRNSTIAVVVNIEGDWTAMNSGDTKTVEFTIEITATDKTTTSVKATETFTQSIEVTRT